MSTDLALKQPTDSITQRIVETYDQCGAIHHLGHCPLPSYREIVDILGDLREILYPGYGRRQNLNHTNVADHVGRLVESLHHRLSEQIARAFRHDCEAGENAANQFATADGIALSFLAEIPELRRTLAQDVQAAFEGDPAAKGLDEIIFCYPGLGAVTVYRLANVLHRLGVPLIPRMMTEYAHGKTGIDIHPGATIGRRFFIDHGTGVVVGETAIIGRNVRLYQSVTLGAKRFETDEAGALRKNYPRHPIVEDDVVIYAGATILGRVTVGRGSSIGGGVWLTHDVAPNSHIAQAKPRQESFDDGAGI
jgi:serine O-acetyltransferase